MSEKLNPYLFVYGTLKLGSKHPNAIYLHRQSQFIGQGSLNGCLYDLGYYPGLVLSSDDKEKVYGQVIKMSKPKLMLSFLDDYEGVGDQFLKPNEYKRKLLEVKMNDLKQLCWTYIYQLPIDNARKILTGNYPLL